MEEIYRLETRDRPRLVAMMRALAAEDSRISFEGALSRTELAQMVGVTSHEGGALKRVKTPHCWNANPTSPRMSPIAK
jgi:hypothetical protein